MRKTLCRCVIASVALMLPRACAWAQATQPRLQVVAPRPPDRVGGRRIVLHLPDPLLSSDIERWSRTLWLSEAQMVVLKDLLRQYKEADHSIAQEILPPLWEKAAAVAACPEEPCDSDELYEMRHRVADRLVAGESPLFGALETILSEQQVAVLPRVRQMRQRQNQQFAHYVQAAAGVDLSELAYQLDISASAPPEFDEILQAYERSLTTLLSHHYSVHWRAIKGAPHAARGLEMAIASAAENQSQMDPFHPALVRFGSLWRPVAKAQERIVDLNRVYVDLLADRLPPEIAAHFVQEFQLRAFPNVYPDSFSIDDVVRSIDFKGLEGAIAEAVQALCEEHARKHRQVCNRMIEAEIDYTERRLATRRASHAEYESHKAEMARLQAERVELSHVSMAAILSLLASPSDEVQQAIARRAQRIADHREIERPPHSYRP